MRSVDGRTWTKLGLERQADLHLMAASYKANGVNVYNAAPNDGMPPRGPYSTMHDGLAWRRAEAAGLKGNILSLAVHPTDPTRSWSAPPQACLFSVMPAPISVSD